MPLHSRDLGAVEGHEDMAKPYFFDAQSPQHGSEKCPLASIKASLFPFFVFRASEYM
jgi:hypothetical protein